LYSEKTCTEENTMEIESCTTTMDYGTCWRQFHRLIWYIKWTSVQESKIVQVNRVAHGEFQSLAFVIFHWLLSPS
jgi:hypothetical protein